jgi:hypothetical protein
VRPLFASVALVVTAGCNQPVDGLDDTLRGCLVKEDGTPAADVPVFALTDGVATREARTDTTGCFALERLTPGRWEVAAHDFQGHGWLEAVHDVDGLFRPLGVRSLASMSTDMRWTQRRGLGLPEALLPATASMRLWCQRGEVSFSDRATMVRVGSNDAPVVASSVVEVDARPPSPGRFSELEEVVGLRWRETGREVPLPPGATAWSRVTAVTERAFLAVAGERGPQFTSATTWVYGAANQTHVLGRTPCELVSTGACVRVEGQPLRVLRWNVDGSVTTLPLEGEVLWSALEPLATQVLLVTRARDGRLAVSRRALDGSTLSDTPLEGTMVEALPARTGPGWWSFATSSPAGQRSWVRVAVDGGAVEVVPLPQRPASAHDVPAMVFMPTASPHPRLEWMRRDGDAWVVTVAEHLGASVRVREVLVPFLEQPTSWYGDRPEGLEFFAGFSLVPLTEVGLEVLQVGSRRSLLEAGAPLDSGRSFVPPGFSSDPVCGVGGRLISLGWRADLVREVQVMDVGPLARALGLRRP